MAIELAIHDRRDPPAGDRVLPELEQARTHRREPTSRSLPLRGRDRRQSRFEGPLDRCRDRAAEGPGEHPAGPLDRGRGRWLSGPTELLGDRRRHEAGLAAGVDQFEVAESRVDLHGEPVKAHAALDPQAQGTDLAWRPAALAGETARLPADPAARVAVATVGFDAELAAGLDHRPLERLDERADEQPA